MASSSYTYRGSTGNDTVPIGGTVLLHYPLADAESGRVDQAKAVAVIGNIQYPVDVGVGIEFDQATESITVTNNTEADWPPQTTVVICVPSDMENLDDLKAWQISVEERLSALEGVAP